MDDELRAGVLSLIQHYRQYEINKWLTCDERGEPQPVGYDFSFDGFAEWLQSQESGEPRKGGEE